MNTKTITVHNVTEQQGKYGPSLRIGYKENDEWENYYVNKSELFPYFVKGKTLNVEVKRKGNWNIITGVAPAQAKAKEGGDAHGRSIELQVLSKVCGELYVAAGKLPSPEEFADWVCEAHEIIFASPEEKLEALKQKAVEVLDATEENDDNFPF